MTDAQRDVAYAGNYAVRALDMEREWLKDCLRKDSDVLDSLPDLRDSLVYQVSELAKLLGISVTQNEDMED